MSGPLVSIVIPSFNQGRFLERAVRSALDQDHAPLEVLVLDGGSRDESVDVLRSLDGAPGLWWKSEPDRGVVDAVNQGLARARGAYCGILSSDDAYLPGAVSQAVAALEADPRLTFVYADAEYVDADDRRVGRTNVEPYSLAGLLSRRTFVIQCSAFFRTEHARRLGGWRASVGYVADNDLWLRLALEGPARRVPGTWSVYRYHPGQRDDQRARIVREWERAVRDQWRRLSPPERRAARVGMHLTAHRYAAPGAWWDRTRHAYAAVANDPTCVVWRDFPRRELLQPVRQVLSRGKRALRAVASRRA
jgi:glycosyltransferase involved in cell wall biosynthesis